MERPFLVPNPTDLRPAPLFGDGISLRTTCCTTLRRRSSSSTSCQRSPSSSPRRSLAVQRAERIAGRHSPLGRTCLRGARRARRATAFPPRSSPHAQDRVDEMTASRVDAADMRQHLSSHWGVWLLIALAVVVVNEVVDRNFFDHREHIDGDFVLAVLVLVVAFFGSYLVARRGPRRMA